MKAILYLIILVVGFFFLVKGADIFVDGSSGLARLFKVPGLVIGLTIVALGTSAPELTVSAIASIEKANEIAISNVLGSNFFNLFVVLGACATLSPLPIDEKVIKRDFPVCIFATLLLFLFVIFSYDNTIISFENMDKYVGVIGFTQGLIFTIIFIIYIVYLIVYSKNNKLEDDNETSLPMHKCILFILIGLICIIGGGKAVVYSARKIALLAGMSETLIGLTIVAIGTSVPELVTSLVAAKKGEIGLAIGNVVGSNIFNLLLIVGVASMIDPIDVNLASFIDIGVLLVFSLICFIFSITSKKINKTEGIIMICLYIGYMLFAAIR